ncbi:sulfotransferase family protein [Aquicoccus sp. SCR17]|nr:sulfotransferase family protein [Carideicomes alvinocaridis]
MSKKKLPATKPASPSRYALFVLGMHRSGTSALSGVLHRLGASLPEDLMEASETNPRGYFEGRKIVGFNDRLLAAAQSHWRDWRPFRAEWFASPRGQEFLPEAKEILETEFGEAPLILIKDPRICRMVPFWSSAVIEAGYTPRYVLTLRNPLEVAKSLQQRNQMEISESLLLWLRHMLDAEAATRGLPRHVTSYGTLLSNWVALVRTLQERLDLVLPQFDDRAMLQIEEFLSGGLRHFDELPEKITDNPALSAWIRETYEIFERWAASGEVKADYKKLDRIRVAFDAAAPIFGELVGPPAEGRRKLQSDLEDFRIRTEKLETELEASREEAGTLQAREERISALEAELKELHGRMAETRSALEQRRHEADQASERAEAAEKARLELAEEKLRHLQELGDMSRRLTETEDAARARLAKETGRWEAELETLRKRAESDRAEAESRVAALMAEQKAAESRLGEQQRELGQLAGLLARSQQELDQAQAESGQEMEARRRLESEVRTLRTVERERQADLARLDAEVKALRSSTSWRITQPLRSVVDRLRGNR